MNPWIRAIHESGITDRSLPSAKSKGTVFVIAVCQTRYIKVYKLS
jgi:hypothetical protein